MASSFARSSRAGSRAQRSLDAVLVAVVVAAAGALASACGGRPAVYATSTDATTAFYHYILTNDAPIAKVPATDLTGIGDHACVLESKGATLNQAEADISTDSDGTLTAGDAQVVVLAATLYLCPPTSGS